MARSRNAAAVSQLTLNTGARRVRAARAPATPAPAAERETPLMQRIRLALNAIPGVRVWRNNVGVDLVRGVRYGMGLGSADLVGIAHGRFFAVEVKSATGRLRPDQERWLDVVRRLGGVAVVARSTDEAVIAAMGAR